MRSVLISIQPKWCELIANRKKTVEVRKTKPKLETPFKVYIYCTKDKKFNFCTHNGEQYTHIGNGKVIGEFVCDNLETFEFGENYDKTLVGTCLTRKEVWDYGKCETMYGWHISNLVIYDTPRELINFEKECKGGCDIPYLYEPPCANCRKNRLTAPPQSWCYLLEGGAN